MNFIPISRPSIEKKEIEYVTDAIKSGWVSSTGEKYIDIFEEKFAQYCNTFEKIKSFLPELKGNESIKE